MITHDHTLVSRLVELGHITEAEAEMEGLEQAFRAVSARAEEVLRELPDGSVELEVPCANLDAFRSWVFGFGEHAEVLGPPEVRAAVAGWLEQMVVPA